MLCPGVQLLSMYGPLPTNVRPLWLKSPGFLNLYTLSGMICIPPTSSNDLK